MPSYPAIHNTRNKRKYFIANGRKVYIEPGMTRREILASYKLMLKIPPKKSSHITKSKATVNQYFTPARRRAKNAIQSAQPARTQPSINISTGDKTDRDLTNSLINLILKKINAPPSAMLPIPPIIPPPAPPAIPPVAIPPVAQPIPPTPIINRPQFINRPRIFNRPVLGPLARRRIVDAQPVAAPHASLPQPPPVLAVPEHMIYDAVPPPKQYVEYEEVPPPKQYVEYEGVPPPKQYVEYEEVPPPKQYIEEQMEYVTPHIEREAVELEDIRKFFKSQKKTFDELLAYESNKPSSSKSKQSSGTSTDTLNDFIRSQQDVSQQLEDIGRQIDNPKSIKMVVRRPRKRGKLKTFAPLPQIALPVLHSSSSDVPIAVSHSDVKPYTLSDIDRLLPTPVNVSTRYEGQDQVEQLLEAANQKIALAAKEKPLDMNDYFNVLRTSKRALYELLDKNYKFDTTENREYAQYINDNDLSDNESDLDRFQKMRIDRNYRDIIEAAKSEGIIGKGKNSNDSDDGLYDDQIDKIMSSFKDYKGSIMRDEIKELLPDITPQSRLGFIINTDPSDKEGLHWQAVYIDARDGPESSNSIEWYDSFARPMPSDVLHDIKLILKCLKPSTVLKLKENKVIMQDDNTSNCGYFACKFLIDRFRGKSFSDATGYNDKIKINHINSDEKEIERLKKLPPFNYILP